MKNVLITGACGQIGSELIVELGKTIPANQLIATDVRSPLPLFKNHAQFSYLDVLDRDKLLALVTENEIDTIFHMAAILSAKGEQNPQLAYNINLGGLFNVLEVARKRKIKRVISPSTIAVFGPDAPKKNTPNETPLNPTTMYGVTKVAGEKLMQYYHQKFGVDTRGLRYPGIISSATAPGGGTTDYAVDMYIHAVKREPYESFIAADTPLPFMYMPDAIKAILDLANADGSRLQRRTYNVNAMSLTPKDIELSIRSRIDDFSCGYKPDYRQAIAESWPHSIDDSTAREEWDWQPDYDLDAMSDDMIKSLRTQTG